jgi:hypothetical protein
MKSLIETTRKAYSEDFQTFLEGTFKSSKKGQDITVEKIKNNQTMVFFIDEDGENDIRIETNIKEVLNIGDDLGLWDSKKKKVLNFDKLQEFLDALDDMRIDYEAF